MGVLRTGRLASVAGRAGGLRPRKAPLGARANRGGLLSRRLSLTRRLRPISRLFPRPSIHIHLWMKAAPQHPDPHPPAAARARRAKPGANAPARQSEAHAAPGRITGGGGRGGVNKPCQATHPRPDPPNTRGSASRSPIVWVIGSPGEEDFSGFGGGEGGPPAGNVIESVHWEL